MASSMLRTRVERLTPEAVSGMWAQRSSIQRPVLGLMSLSPQLMPLQRLGMSPMGTMRMRLPSQ